MKTNLSINADYTERSSRKGAAVSFQQLVVAGKIHEAYAKYISPDMRHHNMAFKGDAASLEKAMEENHTEFSHKELAVKHVLEDGDFVAVHSHISLRPGEQGIAEFHLFRFEGDRIVEMWDLGQPIPKDSPNENGIF